MPTERVDRPVLHRRTRVHYHSSAVHSGSHGCAYLQRVALGVGFLHGLQAATGTRFHPVCLANHAHMVGLCWSCGSQDIIYGYLRPELAESPAPGQRAVVKDSRLRSHTGHAILIAFLTMPLLTIVLLLSPPLCAHIGYPIPDLGAYESPRALTHDADESSFTDLTMEVLRFGCTVNPLYREAVIYAAAVCWVQWMV